MHFVETPIAGPKVVELDMKSDSRGFFARGFCAKEMAENGLDSQVVQANLSFNKERGTLRGMHYQRAPHQESKLVRCIHGSIFDVVVDLRRDSPTYLKWFGTTLSAENRRALFVPKGFGHGYQTLEDNTEVLYLVSEYYEPGAGGGARYDDPLVGIEWPLPATNVSEQDLNWASLEA